MSKNITTRLSRDTTYKKKNNSYQDNLSPNEIKKKLEEYQQVDSIYDVDLNTHLRYFTLDKNGKINKGVDSFILIWRNLSFFWSILGILVSFYPIYLIAKFAYRKFAI